MAIKLIVGLKNPGDKYATTRHNAGAWVLEDLSIDWRPKKDFFGDMAYLSATFYGVVGFLPSSYMNLCGQAVAAIARFYRYQPEEILVVHDELDLPPGTIRLKHGGGHGGHNGLQDIIKHLGTSDFYRLRVGIGHPGHKSDVANYVLHQPSTQERNLIDEAISKLLPVLPRIIKGDFEFAMNELHRR